MTMEDWETRLNRFIEATDRSVLQDAGRVSAEIAKAHAESEFENYRIVQDRLFESDFDRAVDVVENAQRLDVSATPTLVKAARTRAKMPTRSTKPQADKDE